MKFKTLQLVLLVTIAAWMLFFLLQIQKLSQVIKSHQSSDEELAMVSQTSLEHQTFPQSDKLGILDKTNELKVLDRYPVDENDLAANLSPRTPQNVNEKKGIDCGCPHICDERALNKRTPRLICKKRIEWLMEKYNDTEEQACEAASESTPFADSDLPCEIECNPKFCKTMIEKPKLDITGLEIPDPMYERYEGVVIATKVLHPIDIPTLKQMFCLLNAAYNRHVNYDLLVFTTLPWTREQIQDLELSVAPAKLTVAVEGPSLEEHLASMTLQERDFLERRCNVTKGEKLTWFHRCTEENSHLYNNLGYSWQSEFRAYHIWNHEALKPYKYMFWVDSE
jgi:hypothetical protein